MLYPAMVMDVTEQPQEIKKALKNLSRSLWDGWLTNDSFIGWDLIDISYEELQENYGPSAKDIQVINDYIRSLGFETQKIVIHYWW